MLSNQMLFHTSRFVLVVCSLLLLASLVASTECFIQQSVYFDKPSYKVGESGVFSVTIKGETGIDPTLYFTRLEIFFDWGSYWDNVVTTVNPSETKTKSVVFSVPSSVSSGSHSYYYKLTWSLNIGLTNPVTHTSPTNTVLITEQAGGGFWEQFWVILVIMATILIIVVFYIVSSQRKSKAQGKVAETISRKMPSTVYCRYCGAENKADAVFCEKCGKKMTEGG